jgi:hypothetical protein
MTKRTRLRRWLERNVLAIALGVAAGWALDLLVPSVSLSALHGTRADVRAARLLGCYGHRLAELSAQAQRFRDASFSSALELRAAAAPLIAPIVALNDAYVALSSERLTLAVELSRAWPRTTRHAQLVERLFEVEAYQWLRLRPAMNGALVYIIASWRHELDESVMIEIRRQQAHEWEELQSLLHSRAATLKASFKAECESATTRAEGASGGGRIGHDET